MSTYTQILYHIVFGAKDYTTFLTKTNKNVLLHYIVGILRNKLCHPYITNGYGNHVHIVTHLHPSLSLSSLVKDMKMATTELIAREHSEFRNFIGWQVGYGAFTYHISQKEGLIQYVKNQDIHHRRISFKHELINLYKEHGIAFKPEYLLD